MPKALIFGVTGQTGSYLAELLLAKGYQVHGVRRRASVFTTGRLSHIYRDVHDAGRPDFHLHYGDVADGLNVATIIRDVRPDEIYNLAAQSHVAVSFEEPEYTSDIDALGAVRILEAMRVVGCDARFYQASSSELFGRVVEVPQTERTPFHPRSPYGCAKAYAYYITQNYREAYALFASNGILFNHESQRRGETFVSRKITQGLCRIYRGTQDCLYLGNLDAKRDWGHAGDYAEAIHLIVRHSEPDDFVVATGEQHSVRDFVVIAGERLGMRIVWDGSGDDEAGIDVVSGKTVVRVDPRYKRPAEVDTLLGDATKARTVLGWKPRHTFAELVGEMVEHDLGLIDGR